MGQIGQIIKWKCRTCGLTQESKVIGFDEYGWSIHEWILENDSKEKQLHRGRLFWGNLVDIGCTT